MIERVSGVRAATLLHHQHIVLNDRSPLRWHRRLSMPTALASCPPPDDCANDAAHLNGKIDYLGTVSGQGMTLKADSTCANGVRCNGTCHGNNDGHNNKCW